MSLLRVRVLMLLLCLSTFAVIFAMNQVRVVNHENYSKEEKQLVAEYGANVTCPETYRLPLLIALSHYPELKGVFIEVKMAKIGTTAACRPHLLSNGSVFVCDSGKEMRFRRKYTLLINEKAGFEGILFDSVPFNAQVGILAHEVAHIVDYEQRSIFGLMGRAIDYMTVSGKRTYETEIDKITIAHGCGWQLYDWSDFAMNRSRASEKYKAFKRRIYLSPDQIQHCILELSSQKLSLLPHRH